MCAVRGSVEDQEHIMLRCDDRRMVARRSGLMADIHTHVGRVIHRGGPGADQGRRRWKQLRTSPGTTQRATRFTPGFLPQTL